MISSNAGPLAARYRTFRSRMDQAVALGLRDALVAVHNEAQDRLSGSAGAASFAYPVPVRHPSGGLRSRLGFRKLGQFEGVVYNSDPGAYGVHSGDVPTWPDGLGRPFLDDAMEAAEPSRLVRRRMAAALGLSL